MEPAAAAAAAAAAAHAAEQQQRQVGGPAVAHWQRRRKAPGEAVFHRINRQLVNETIGNYLGLAATTPILKSTVKSFSL